MSTQPDTTPDTFACECGQTFTSAMSLGLHRKAGHGTAPAPDRAKRAVRIGVQTPSTPPIDSGAAPVTDLRADRLAAQRKERDARAAVWALQIERDLNPLLTTVAAQFIGAPAEWLDLRVADVQDLSVEDRRAFSAKTGFVGLGPVLIGDAKLLAPVWNPSLRNQLAIDRGKAKRFATAAAQFADSPMGLAMAGWVNTHQELIALAMAGWAAGTYGWHLMSMRQAIVSVQTTLAQIQQAQSQGLGMPIPDGAES